MNRCESCKHWDTLSFPIEEPQPIQWGRCRSIVSGEGREDIEASGRAFTSDASDYSSWLTTRADFGCVEHTPRPDTGTPQ